jgi:hypothetical protein
LFHAVNSPEGYMTITQTIEVPADHRVFLEFVAPQEIPEGEAKVEMKLTPVIKNQTDQRSDTPLNKDDEPATPISDSLFGILSGLGDISLEQIREDRLAKHLK